MPDHVHVLFELGEKLSVGRCVARWKSEARRLAGYAGEWRRDFWEHRLRDGEEIEDYGFYIFLNPYRAGLIDHHLTWPWWWPPDPRAFRFIGVLKENGAPQPEWADLPEARFTGLAIGE
jgi:hypothetical protein